jgi:crotonobetainyl-CoA:carnitine CoA-transferase CaiB-like acyl-CoA transferase
MAATGIAAAVAERERTGRGGQIDVSLAEAATWALSGSDGEFNGHPWGIPVTAERRLYRCSDGRYVTVAAQEPRTWKALCEGLGFGELAEAGPPRGQEDGPAERFAPVFATRPAAEWVQRLGPAGAGISAVNRGWDLPDDPHVRARESLVTVAGATVPGNPIRISGPGGKHSGSRTTAPPEPGADTEAVLLEAGYTPDQIDELERSGAVSAGSIVGQRPTDDQRKA